MNSVPSPQTGAHLDLDALADVLAGEADAAGTGHLSACSSCTSRLGELQAAESRVVAVLSALPPPPVPDDLADRISAALAREAPLRPSQASVTALPAAAEPPARRRRSLPAAAAAVLLVSGAGIGWSVLSGSGGGDSGADTAAVAGPEVRVSASGTDYADADAVAAALPGVLTQGELRRYASVDSATGAGAAGAAEDSAARAESAPEAPAAALSAADPLERLRTPEGLTDCLAGLQATPEEAPVEPLALDFATYDGAPALAVVLRDPDPGKLSVFVVGPACAAADADLLHFVRVNAP